MDPLETFDLARIADLRAELAELEETQGWVHHVADLDSGRIHSTKLRRPVAPRSRLQRFNRLGHSFDDSIFGGPSYRLTPRQPYQASPLAHFMASNCTFYGSDDDKISWWLPEEALPTHKRASMRFYFAESPHRRSVVTLWLSGYSWQGRTGHVQVRAASSPEEVRVPIGPYSAHTIDLTFVPFGGRVSDILVEVEAGVRNLNFTAVTFQALQPGLDPG